MFGLGIGEVLLLAIFALIFIGPKKLPGLARSIGRGVRELQNASQELMGSIQISANPEKRVENIQREKTAVSENDQQNMPGT